MLYAESFSLHFIFECAYIYVCNDVCPGLFINESMSNVHVLLYADDVAMINNTTGRLQC